MLQFSFLDGPLEGQTVGSTTGETEGEVMDVEIVDVGDAPGTTTRFTYRVVTTSHELLPGTLRHVAGAA